ncbi:universal stress protein [Methanolobus sp.]|uniref:universal stress protein n=1 Tax=Methanolobus sp. TaxID=1874737 RepID=UPI0025D3E1D8|nr:universal stress protein [Methanolobus sp.]
MRCTAIRKIMIATDGSENAINAIDCGIGLAKANGAEVKAIYVIPSDNIPVMLSDLWVKALDDKLKEEGLKATEYVVAAGKSQGVDVEPFVINAKTTRDGIIDFARENNIDLIVIGTLGRTGFSHVLLGSVAESVVRYSKKRVLVVP